MRYIAWIGALVVLFVFSIYVVAFTPLGNSFLKPMVEREIKAQTKLDSKLHTFLLSIKSFEIVLELSNSNKIKASGNYSLFSKTFNVSYEVKFDDLKSLKPLIAADLRGSFETSGVAKGSLDSMNIEGVSTLAQSTTTYYVLLDDLNPKKILASVKDAKLASLLYMSAQNPYATGSVDLDIDFKNITPHKLDGTVLLNTKNTKLDPKYMKSDFDVTIPQTTFSMKLDAKLMGDDIDYKYDFSSNLFKIASWGKVVPQPLRADLNYELDISDLEVLKPITGADIRGEFKLKGDVRGTKDELLVKAKSSFASSNTAIEALLKDFKPSWVKANIKNLDIAKLLFMLKQPHYTDGTLSVDADIKDARASSLDGKVALLVDNALLDSNFLTKEYKFKSPMPKTSFKLSSVSILNKINVDTKLNLDSTLANLSLKNAVYNIKDASLKSDYEAKILDLDKLFFITQRHLRGDIRAYGEVSKGKDLLFTMNSNIADGKVEVKLKNDDFYAKVSSLKANKLFYMLLYPQIVQADLNGEIEYDLAKSKGKLDVKVANAIFTKNQTFDLIKQYTQLDMYKEFFSGDVNAKIEKENVLASIDMRSINAAIKAKEAKFNTKTQNIDSDVTLEIKKDKLNANISGNINSPKVNINLEEFLKSQTGKKVIEQVDKLFKKLF